MIFDVAGELVDKVPLLIGKGGVVVGVIEPEPVTRPLDTVVVPIDEFVAVKLPVAETLLDDMLLTDAVGFIVVLLERPIDEPGRVLESEVSLFVAVLSVMPVFDGDVVMGLGLEADIELETPEL